MKNAIKKFKYNGSQIEFEIINGQVMANATAMCDAFGKRPVDWQKLPTTKKYMAALKAKWENLTLVISKQGGNEAGTWIHEKLILKLAQWLDVEFELWCDEKIAELLAKGTVSIDPKSRRINQLRKSGKDEQFIQLRLQAVDSRNEFTGILKTHGVEGEGYPMCTRAIYAGVFGGDGSTSFIRQKLGIGKKAPIRDNVDGLRLAMISLSEQAALQRIQQDNLEGNVQCTEACKAASQAVAKAVMISQKQILPSAA